MTEQIELRTAGPHSPDYTMQVANAIAEAVRVLNHATLPVDGAPGLNGPVAAERLLGALHTALTRFPQLVDQVKDFLAAQGRTWAHAAGGDPEVELMEAAHSLGLAHTAAVDLATFLGKARESLSGLYAEDDDDE